MKLHYLQHVAFEGLGFIESWAAGNNVEVSVTRLFDGEALPAPDAFDTLVVMGGPMGIYDHEASPWMVEEKAFIGHVITNGKPVLGICLGAQLIADVLGARVYPGPHKEIGWFPIRRAPDAPAWFPEELAAFHWHGDTFDLPEGAVRLASSGACLNQGFCYRDRVIGLQFHLETTEASMEALIENCAHELVEAPFIQSAEQMRTGRSGITTINKVMANLLNNLLQDQH